MRVTGVFSPDGINVWWDMDGTAGHAKLGRSDPRQPTNLRGTVCTWDQFVEYARRQGPGTAVYRGQEDHRWRLATSFHRRGRSDMVRFMTEDVPALHRILSSRTRHFFDLSDSQEYGAFLHLVQHHGYPTPFLDWTFSPFVAAFFAFKNIPGDYSPNGPEERFVRIYSFDSVWRTDVAQYQLAPNHPPHVSFHEFHAIENPRMIPQQALSAITSVEDVEYYIEHMEKVRGKKYLFAMDIPASERSKAMIDLARMGITAGSMFPGLDGACEELKERFFQ
jgi:hypothetical protein